MTALPDPTLGEVYRLLLEQSMDLREIKSDVKSQSGVVAAIDKRVAVLEDRHNQAAYVGSGFGVLAVAIIEAAKYVWGAVKQP